MTQGDHNMSLSKADRMDRRGFLKTTAAGAALAAGLPLSGAMAP